MVSRGSGVLMRRREFISLFAAPAMAQVSTSVEQWGVFELALPGPSSGNPFTEVTLSARFRYGSRTAEVDGFYDGDGRYRIRYSPDQQGEWTYETRSNSPELTGKSGAFVCASPGAGNHGPVAVRDTYHFAYADGARGFPFGTTCYAWAHQAQELEEQTLATLPTAPFNKIRMCILPTEYAYSAQGFRPYPFEHTAEGKQDFTRPRPAFFRHLEARVLDLQRLGIQADLILFHPYGRGGYANMGAEADDRYLRYVIARFGAFRNVWWSMANEYNFAKTKTAADWERLGAILKSKDPYGRLASIHNGGELENMYDHSRPWITHVSLQSSQLTEGRKIRARFTRPVLYDECKYEGNISRRWGDISGREMVHRFWLGAIEGCYVGHGETYEHPSNVIWVSRGGVLRGESPKRIAFLREILENGPPRGLTALDSYYPCAAVEGEYYLYYFDVHQPARYAFGLPADARFRIDLIDPWEMTVTPLEGAFQGKAPVALPGRPYLAARIRRIS